MARPRVLVLRAPGTNCDHETAFAFEQAGGAPELVHINRLLDQPQRASNYQILCIPGGFSYGDDIAAGRILANQIRHHLADVVRDFRDAGKLILGICNGFQVLIKAGILLHDDQQGALATLTWNDSGRFEDRWVSLDVQGGQSVFLRNVVSLYLPVAHAEGKFVPASPQSLQQLDDSGQLVLRYAAANGQPSGPVPYPDNPNGSEADVAGACDATGRVLGLMPHPERFVDPTQHPRWTREELPERGHGCVLFDNAVGYFAS
jgi:phosphoribosylformylglycinamidine synthase